jgi:hypothetical protein
MRDAHVGLLGCLSGMATAVRCSAAHPAAAAPAAAPAACPRRQTTLQQQVQTALFTLLPGMAALIHCSAEHLAAALAAATAACPRRQTTLQQQVQTALLLLAGMPATPKQANPQDCTRTADRRTCMRLVAVEVSIRPHTDGPPALSPLKASKQTGCLSNAPASGECRLKLPSGPCPMICCLSSPGSSTSPLSCPHRPPAPQSQQTNRMLSPAPAFGAWRLKLPSGPCPMICCRCSPR